MWSLPSEESSEESLVRGARDKADTSALAHSSPWYRSANLPISLGYDSQILAQASGYEGVGALFV